MKYSRSFFFLFALSLIVYLTACGGTSDPISSEIDRDQVMPRILGLNTDGVSIDGSSIDPDHSGFSVAPGTTHLVTFDPPVDNTASEFDIQCSSGSWRVDGVNVGYALQSDRRSFEWVAPQGDTEVQLLFTPENAEDGYKLGLVINVSDDFNHTPSHTPIPISMEATFANPITGELVTAAAGELLVKLSDDISLTEILNLRAAQDYQMLERIIETESIFRLRFDSSVDLTSAWGSLALDPRIEVVEPNYLAYPAVVPDDPEYDNKHEFPKIDAELAWDLATGSADVWVAVVDTGVDRDHPDLAGNVMPGHDFVTGGDELGGETPGDGEDNNGDGIPDQNVGHGTHCAGIIAAEAFNGEGACGVAYNTKIFPLRIFPSNGDTGATFSSIIQAIDCAANEENVKVISMSIGTTYESSLLQSAINDAWDEGKVIVAAAANSNTDDMYYPGAHDNVIAVAALNKSGMKASFSNYGDWVDISAYGTGIYSSYFDDNYAYMSGTSMACPLVAGCVALLFSYRDNLTNEQAVSFLTTYFTDVYADNPGYIGQLGSGCVNPYLALDAMYHSEPADLNDADSDGGFSDTGLELGPNTQG